MSALTAKYSIVTNAAPLTLPPIRLRFRICRFLILQTLSVSLIILSFCAIMDLLSESIMLSLAMMSCWSAMVCFCFTFTNFRSLTLSSSNDVYCSRCCRRINCTVIVSASACDIKILSADEFCENTLALINRESEIIINFILSILFDFKDFNFAQFNQANQRIGSGDGCGNF